MKRPIEIAKSLLPDALMLAGVAALAHGASRIYVPAGWIVAGGFAFAFGLLLARRAGET
jgi:hypothetical protein